MVAPEPSMVGSERSYTATDLSRRTDRTSYSIPDDGRAVTITTERKRRKRENLDTQSVLSHGTKASLLIEYFENGKPGSSSSGRQPSVRVKVTPSSAGRRHRVNQSADGAGLEISEVANTERPGRRPVHTHRIQLSPTNGDDKAADRTRSYSGDQSTLSSITSADDSVGGHAPLNVTVIRESGSPGSVLSSRDNLDGTGYAERRQRRRTASRNGAGDPYYEISKQPRSRSASRESEIYDEPGQKQKLGRRKSRSMSRERAPMSQEERVEQAFRQELNKVQNTKSRRDSRLKAHDNNNNLKPPRQRSRSRGHEGAGILDEIAAEKARARRKAAEIEGEDSQSVLSGHGSNNPAFMELIRGTIRELLLPEIEELKAKQQKAAALQMATESTLSRSLSVKGPGRATSMPDVMGKPVVVLSPDVPDSNGLGMVIAGDDKVETEDDIANQRAPGFGVGVPNSPFHSESGEGVSLVGTMPVAGEERVRMPDIPFRTDTPGTYAETRASILTANTGLPYPVNIKLSGMPSSGTTPPPGAPKSELFPELSELNLGCSDVGASSLLSDHSAVDAGQTNNLARIGPSSMGTLNLDSEVNHDHDRASASASATSSKGGSAQPAYSDLSLQDMSVAATSVLAKERKEKSSSSRRSRSTKDIDELSEICERDDVSTESQVKAVNLFFAEQRERQQERALLNPGSFQDMSVEVNHVSTATVNSLGARALGKDVNTGHQVFDLGANPSMCSTPILAQSAVASVFDPSNVGSAVSYNRPDSQQSPPPLPLPLPTREESMLGSSAIPNLDDPMPDFGHLHPDDDIDEDDDINTNPSIIQGPIGHHTTSWEMAANDFGVNVGDRGDLETPVSPNPIKDEGYMSSANPIGSPGTASPMRGDAGMGAIDDMLSDPDFYRGHQRNRLGSGNSHGMPSPLYDSSTGRGIERIDSKDIVALMEHLTVRDAQRNARDTEILVTLVRSAAEMRNSFEDLKKALADQRRDIVTDVDHNTERSVQKLLQGPRPLPAPTPRKPRYSKSDEDAEDEGRAKRASVFRRALKGLSMGSSKDLERIEEMLCKLLGEVEGLKDGQHFYQQSLLHSQSMGTIDQLRSTQDPADPNTFANNSVGNSYHSAGPSRQPSGNILEQHKGTHISPIQEDVVLDTHQNAPLDAPPNSKMPAVSTSLGNTPTKTSEKHAKRESGSSFPFPRVSGFGKIFKGKNNQEGSEASRSPTDFNYWETEAAKGTQGELHQSPFDSDGQRTEGVGSPLVPPSLRDADAPINQSSRISLDLQHPRPRVTYNHQLEQQAQQLTAEGGGFLPGSPQNASVSSLGNYPPLGPGGFQNGKLLSPLAQDAYAQHQAQMAAPSLLQQAQMVAVNTSAPARPPKIVEDESIDGDSSTKKHRKHRERDENGEKIKKPKKERTEEEKQRRREKREKKKSREFLSDAGDGLSGRTPSTASRLNGPRPLSNASNKENSRRHRHQNSQATNDTVGGDSARTYR